MLYDATDGQQQFGKITIVNNDGPKFTGDGCFNALSEASISAEYWIEPQAGRAHATLSLYGQAGQHIMLYFSSDFLQVNGADGDAYTIAHEHSHHAYGLYDEYADRTGQPTAECAGEADTAALNFCLMDNYFTRGGRANAGPYTLNEFCVAANHDPDRDTLQDFKLGQSGWSTIGQHLRRSATPPQGLPVDAPPEEPADVVQFIRMGGELRVMLVIDRSASMADLDRMTYAKDGAKTLVNLLRPGDSVGVVSYSSSATLDAPLAVVASTDPNDPARVSARNAVEALTPGGGTYIADGLRTAANHFRSYFQRSANEVIILVSDGNNNTGDAPSSAIPLLQQSPEIPVMALLVGSINGSGDVTLQNIAAETGGKYFPVNTPASLKTLMLIAEAESSHAGLVTLEKRQTLTPGANSETSAFIEIGARGAIFGVSFITVGANVRLSLRTPSGRIITEGELSTRFGHPVNRRQFRQGVSDLFAGGWHMDDHRR